MKHETLLNLLLLVCCLAFLYSCTTSDGTRITTTDKNFAKCELEKSAEPLRPGEPGKTPFWNTYAKRFIFAPAFDFPKVRGAEKYTYEILSLGDSSTCEFESDIPYAPLTPVWTSVPVGFFHLTVTGLSGDGERIGVAGGGQYFRAATFNGPYHKPVIPYDSSAIVALDKIMYKEYVEYWLTHKAPDSSYYYYRYPAKIFGSLIVGAVTHARLKAGQETADRSVKIARIVADYLIGISFPKGAPLEYFPPTYYGHSVGKNPGSHMKLTNYMTISAAESGHAYLDLYELVGEEKYLNAAKRIAETFLETQLDNGTWYLYVNNQTGEPTAETLAIPTAIINYFDRLRTDFKMKKLDEPTRKAFDWIMVNPVKTFHWVAQYEDVDIRKYDTYERLSREQPCDLAIYLFKNYPDNEKYSSLAGELIRFAEDQFITWEQMEDLVVYKDRTIRPVPDSIKTKPGWYSRTWMTPVVHEQYGFWMPSARNTGLMVETYWHAYEATGKDVYLAKALSIANNFTRVQKEHDGDYPTMFTKHKMNFWINNAIYPARVMMTLSKNLEERND